MQTLRGASEAAGQAQSHGIVVLAGDFLHLLGELSSGQQHKHGRAFSRSARRLVDGVDEAGQDEAESLAGAGLRDGDHVASAQRHRPRDRLDDGGLLVVLDESALDLL